MENDDILAKVRRAVKVADSIHGSDAGPAEKLLLAAVRCRQAQQDFLDLLVQMHPPTTAGEQARAELLRQLALLDDREELLRRMLETGAAQESEIHTQTAPGRLQ